VSAGGEPQVQGTASSNEAAVGATLDGLRNFRHNYWAPVLLGLIMLFDSWDAVAIAYAMPALAADWHLDPLIMGLLMSAGYSGQFIGAVSLGAVAERYGRLPVCTIAAAIMSLLAIACAVAPDYRSLLALRFLQGIMIGGALPIAVTYVNELAPTATRGRYFGWFQLPTMSGMAICAISSNFIVPHLGWRWLFGLGAIPIVLIPLVWLTLPESPRWLVRAGRLDAANRALAKLGAAPIAFTAGESASAAPRAKKSTIATLFSGPLLSRTLTITMLWALTTFISNGLTTWVPSLYVKSFHMPVDRALAFSATTSTIMFLALTISGILIDRLGRRRLALIGLVFTFIPLLGMAALRPAGDFVIFGTFVVAQTACFFAIFATWPYTAEIYPTNVRALGLGYGSSVGRAASMTMPILVGFVLSRGAPIQIVLAIFGLFALGAFLVWVTRTRETAGIPLEAA